MRYLTPRYIYGLWLALRTVAKANGEGQTFSPEMPRAYVMDKLAGAAARPRTAYEGTEAHRELFSKVAALGHGIAANHCFGNGNKRTSFLAMNQMMSLNGWGWSPPPDVVAFIMLRAASNQNRMHIEELATFVGAFAYQVPDKDRKYRYISDGLVHNGSLEIDGPDEFPSTVTETQAHYLKLAGETWQRHSRLISEDEREELARTFSWPSDVVRKMVRWYNMERYRLKLWKRQHYRRRYKRIGRRRCPHLGGRTVKKICPPITRRKMGLS